MRNFISLAFFIGFLFLIFFTAAAQENNEWTIFRGAKGTGLDTRFKAPEFNENTHFKWETELPGTGHSSPVIWGENIFVSSSDDSTNVGYLMAVDSRTGKILWQKEFVVTDLSMHVDNNLAAASPAVDNSSVYIVWYSAEKTNLIALSHEGVIQWEASFDGIVSRHGGGSSLILTESDVIFTREQEEGSPLKSSWLAVSKQTGEISWEIIRKSSTSNSFSTPLLLGDDKQKSQSIFTSEGHGLTSVDPASGKVLWELPEVFAARAISSPIYSDGMLIGFYKGGGAVFKLDMENKPIADTAFYSFPRSLSPYVPTPIVVGELLFLFMDNGRVACLRLATGELLWNERPDGPFYGSPICVDGSLFCITKTGNVLKIQADSTYEFSGILELGDGSHSTPALCSRGILFRTFTKLMLLEL